jgi:antitoxin component YwqK of YwqJK toxin-antitoxin module
MKGRLFFIVLLLIPFLAFSQEQINGFDSNNLRHGLWEKTYKGKNTIRYSGEFNHGKEIGVFKFYDESGKLVAEKVYKPNSEICHAILYNKNKSTAAEGDFMGKKKHGFWKYYNLQGQLLMTENYKNGVLEGDKVTFYDNGKVTEKSFYKNNKLNGKVFRYTDDGVQISCMTYKDGKLDGVVEYSSTTGELLVKGFYKDGKRVGEWKHFSKGKVVSTKNYDK